MLKDIIPARFRRYVYAAYAVAAVVLGALQVASVNTGKAADVLAYLGIAVGAVAASNTNPPQTRNDDGAADTGLLLWVCCLIGIVLLLFGIHFR